MMKYTQFAVNHRGFVLVEQDETILETPPVYYKLTEATVDGEARIVEAILAGTIKAGD